MKICSIHKIPAVHKEGTSKAGKPYSFDACPTPPVDGVYCKAEIIELPAEDPQISEIREPVVEPKPTDWDEVARGNMAIEAMKIACNFWVRKDIDDEAKLEELAERIFIYAWKKRITK